MSHEYELTGGILSIWNAAESDRLHRLLCPIMKYFLRPFIVLVVFCALIMLSWRTVLYLFGEKPGYGTINVIGVIVLVAVFGHGLIDVVWRSTQVAAKTWQWLGKKWNGGN